VAGWVDAYSRRVVGWAMSDRLDTRLPLDALRMALEHRPPPQGLLHPSDRGGPYASEAYRTVLTQRGALASMSRKGNGYDNARRESFWATLKKELAHRRRFQTRGEAYRAIFESIEGVYNRQRLHSSLGYQSPVDFEPMKN
jgi:transposase InsO family protein